MCIVLYVYIHIRGLYICTYTHLSHYNLIINIHMTRVTVVTNETIIKNKRQKICLFLDSLLLLLLVFNLCEY